MLLSLKERRVLAATELAAEKPMQLIRKETGFRDHTIRYALQQLAQRGIIKKHAFINMYPLGFADYAIYFSLLADKEALKEKFLQELCAAQNVTWIATLGGDYQYGLAISARHHTQVLAFLDRISTRYPGAFLNKALSLRVALALFPRKYLAPGAAHCAPLVFGGRPRQVQVDQKDFQILTALEQEEFSSHRELARKLDMPATTLEHRLSQLERSGIIVGHFYRLEAAAIGMLHFRLLLFARGVNPQLRKKLYTFSEAHPHVVYYIECLGDWDHELGVEVEGPEQMVAVTEELYRNFGHEINAVRVLPLFNHRKIINFPFKELSALDGGPAGREN